MSRFLRLGVTAFFVVAAESKYEWNAWQKAKEKQAAGDAPAWYAKTKATTADKQKATNAWQRAKEKEANGEAPAWMAAVKEKTAEKQKATSPISRRRKTHPNKWKGFS